jgi:hypothetical protein
MRDNFLDTLVILAIITGAACIPLSHDYTRCRMIHAVVNRLPMSPAEQAATYIVNNPGTGLDELPDELYGKLESKAIRNGMTVYTYFHSTIKYIPQ